MPDATDNPHLRADDATMLLTEAIGFVRQWDFIANHAEIPVTPRQCEELKKDREDWLDRANRWAANKPEFQHRSHSQAAATSPLRQSLDMPCSQ